MTRASHRARLVRQIRRAFTLGVPGIILGLGVAVGAVWLGLDYTGLALLATGVLLTGMGLFLLGVGLYCSALLFEGWLRVRLSRRVPNRGPSNTTEVVPPTAVLPPAEAAPPADSLKIF